MPEIQTPQPENAFRSFQKELKRTNQLLAKQTSYFQAFLRGILMGFGGFVGATVLIAIVVWFTSKIQLIPIIGDFAIGIVEFVNENTSN